MLLHLCVKMSTSWPLHHIDYILLESLCCPLNILLIVLLFCYKENVIQFFQLRVKDRQGPFKTSLF